MSRTASRTEQEQANLDLVLAMFAEVLNPMDSSAAKRFIAEDYIQHNQAVEPGRAALEAFLDMIRAQTPEAVHDVKRAFADGDHVIVHYHVRRWPGDLGWAVIDIFRVEDGLVVEHWDVMQDVIEGGPNPNSPF
jgi:predicted SnoaL-like aldol condensation-catalyzing enzyme